MLWKVKDSTDFRMLRPPQPTVVLHPQPELRVQQDLALGSGSKVGHVGGAHGIDTVQNIRVCTRLRTAVVRQSHVHHGARIHTQQ